MGITQWSRRRMVVTSLLVLTAVFFITLAIGLSQNAYGAVPPTVVINQTIRDDAGTVHVLSTTTVDPELIAGSCTVTVTGENNQSVHPDNNIMVASANTVTVPDVERAAGAQDIPADGTLVLNESITISVLLGSDGVFSGGALVVDFDCVPPTPPTTVRTYECGNPPDHDFENPTDGVCDSPPTTIAIPPTTVVTPPPANSLPRTGDDWGQRVLVGLSLLVVGGALLWATAYWARRKQIRSEWRDID